MSAFLSSPSRNNIEVTSIAIPSEHQPESLAGKYLTLAVVLPHNDIPLSRMKVCPLTSPAWYPKSRRPARRSQTLCAPSAIEPQPDRVLRSLDYKPSLVRNCLLSTPRPNRKTECCHKPGRHLATESPQPDRGLLSSARSFRVKDQVQYQLEFNPWLASSGDSLPRTKRAKNAGYERYSASAALAEYFWSLAQQLRG